MEFFAASESVFVGPRELVMEGKRSSVIYMLRTMQQHHVQLSMMADAEGERVDRGMFCHAIHYHGLRFHA